MMLQAATQVKRTMLQAVTKIEGYSPPNICHNFLFGTPTKNMPLFMYSNRAHTTHNINHTFKVNFFSTHKLPKFFLKPCRPQMSISLVDGGSTNLIISFQKYFDILLIYIFILSLSHSKTPAFYFGLSPYFGNLHLLAGAAPPHYVFRDLSRQHDPLMRVQLGDLSDVEVAKEVFRNHDTTFSNRPHAMFDGIIEEHRAAGGDGEFEDLMDILLKCQKEGSEMPLTDGDIKAVMLDMFLGDRRHRMGAVGDGEEPPHSEESASGSAKSLRRHGARGRREAPRAQVGDAENSHSRAPPRAAREQTLNGYEIPANTRLLVHAWALARDPRYWPDAEKFMPERFENAAVDYKGNDFEYVPFGSGRRICPGVHFAAANLDLALATLLYHFDWALPNGVRNEDLDMTEAFSLTVRRKNHLLLVPTLQRPLSLYVVSCHK